MRITDKMRFDTTRADMNRLQNRSTKIYRELSSGKKINRLSDDPFGALQATGLATHKRLLTQYSRNIDTAKINLYAADNALLQTVNIITEARTTTLSSVSVVGDAKSHSVMADSISQLKEQLFNLANSRVADTYIFGGFQNTRTPYVADGLTNEVSYRGDTGAMQLEIGEGSLVETTLKGASAFGGDVVDIQRSAGMGYTGEISVFGQLPANANHTRLIVEVLNPGSPNAATYQVSFDGGATFDDNGGGGFSLSELNTTGPLGNLGVQLRLPDQNSNFLVGDQISLELTPSDSENLFKLFDELELALREVDNINTLGAIDYDGNGIDDAQDILNAEQAVRDANDPTIPGNTIQNPLTGAELDYQIRQARNQRFSEISDSRIQNLLGRIDIALAQVSDHQSFIGLGLNKVESAEAANSFLHEQVTTTLAHVEDSDFVEAVSELNLVETALQAATSTTSRVLQSISLLDYLR